MSAYSMTYVTTLADLKAFPPSDGALVQLISKTAVGDSLGGVYRWNSSATGTDDATYMNIITSNLIGTGRWIRIGQGARETGGGILVMANGIKTFFVGATTVVSGSEAITTTHLTDTGLSTGTNLLSELWHATAIPVNGATSVTNAVTAYQKTSFGENKTIVFGYSKINPVLITLALVSAIGGLNYSPTVAVSAGVPIRLRFEGK